MGWIKVEQSLVNHHKTFALADALDISQSEAVGILVGLWSWALDNVDENGVLPDISDRAIQRITGSSADGIFRALLETGFIDEYLDSYRIHNWQEYGGKCIAEQNAYRDRMKKAREKKAEYRKSVNEDKTIEVNKDRTIDINEDRTIDVNRDTSIELIDKTRQDKTRRDENIGINTNITKSGDGKGVTFSFPMDKVANDVKFEIVWSEYPRKVGKANAKKAFDKLNPDAELYSKICKAIEVQKNSAQWKKDGGQFIPHFATWLNGKRWEDEVPVTSDKHSGGSFDTDEMFSKAMNRSARMLSERKEQK